MPLSVIDVEWAQMESSGKQKEVNLLKGIQNVKYIELYIESSKNKEKSMNEKVQTCNMAATILSCDIEAQSCLKGETV